MSNEDNMMAMMKKKNWALVGATPNTEKVANRIYHTFKQRGYHVMPVNPKYQAMDDGEAIYADLSALPEKADCVDFVVPPTVTLETLEKMDPEEFPNVWFQPGTFDGEVIRYAEEKGFTVVQGGACTMAFMKAAGCRPEEQ